MKFTENEDNVNSNIIGQIVFKKIKIFSDQLENTKSLDIKSKLNGFKIGNKIDVGILENGNFIKRALHRVHICVFFFMCGSLDAAAVEHFNVGMIYFNW